MRIGMRMRLKFCLMFVDFRTYGTRNSFTGDVAFVMCELSLKLCSHWPKVKMNQKRRNLVLYLATLV